MQSEGLKLIILERHRQITDERWTTQHDDLHSNFELTRAAISYLFQIVNPSIVLRWWPWNFKWWKPSDDPIRNLVKAGALIAAEIDRLERKNHDKSSV